MIRRMLFVSLVLLVLLPLPVLLGGCFVALAPPQPADAQAVKSGLRSADRARATTQQIDQQQRQQDQQIQRLQQR